MRWQVELFRAVTSGVGFAEVEAPTSRAAREMAFELVRSVRRGQTSIEWRGESQVIAVGLTGVTPIEHPENWAGLERNDR